MTPALLDLAQARGEDLRWWTTIDQARRRPSTETLPPAAAAAILAREEDVWTFNERAQAFSRRHGFVTYNERLWLR